MIAALEHSAIVPVYDFGEDQDVPFIVMRMMSGGSLADKLKNDHLSIEDAAQVVIRVAAALGAAHQKGIIHRDLKPGNILFDQYDNAFLSDFGIARLAEAGATLTGSNILGTPAYMSPEQVQGDKAIDGRSDIYAMGVIFYQMLIGNTPYQATTPAKVMMMHLLEPVPRLISSLPEVTPAVEAWFEKTLAKDPDERFATAAEMAKALQAALRDEVQATQKSTPPVQDLDRTVAANATAVVAVTPPRGTQPPAATSAAAAVPSTPYQAAPMGAPPEGGTPPPATPLPRFPYPTADQPQSSGKSWLPVAIVGLVLAGIVVIGLIAVVLLGFGGTGPLAMLASASATPTFTAAPPTPTELSEVLPGETVASTATPTEMVVVATDVPEPTDETLPPTEALPTDTPEPTLAPTSDALVLGGADAIAFIDKNEIYVMNIDGGDLRQLTSDGAEKTRLSWTPDGAEIIYISGLCAWSIDYETGRQDFLACFDTAKDLSDFSVSSDGSQVAVVLNQNLYVVPFDREGLLQARSISDLTAMGEACQVLAPLQTSNGTNVIVNHVAWSKDDTRMAINVVAPVNGIQSDLIRFTDISSCQYTDVLDEFPSRRLEIDNYEKYPYIQNFGYDGYVLFSLVSYTRNDGFGDLYFYNTSLYRSESKVNPIGGTCCYRDPQFSPDGRYLIFAYQAYDPNATTQLYFAPYATLGTGTNLQPIPLPEDMLTDRKAKPQPALRPVPGQ